MNSSTIVKLQQLWNVGAWEGDYMPRTNAFIIRVPSSLHSEIDGDFTSEELRAVSVRHAAAGTYPLLHFTATEPIITAISDAGAGNITIVWTNHKAGTTYEILGTTKNPLAFNNIVWTSIVSGIVENPAGNTRTFAAVEDGLINYIWVKAIDIDGDSTLSDSLEVVKYAAVTVAAI